MRTYITPIGFNTTSVTRPVLSHGIESGDGIVLIRPLDEPEDRRAEETLSDVERMLGEIEPDVSLRMERIPHDDFGAAVLACSDVFYGASGDVITIFGGGARDVILPFTVASLTHVDCISTALAFSDIDGSVREFALPQLTARVPEAAWDTLTAIDRVDETSIPALTEDTDQSKSTVTRHVNQLTDRGLVETWMEGKTKHVRGTLTGGLLLRSRG